MKLGVVMVRTLLPLKGRAWRSLVGLQEVAREREKQMLRRHLHAKRHKCIINGAHQHPGGLAIARKALPARVLTSGPKSAFERSRRADP